jgi:hypothetical protein
MARRRSIVQCDIKEPGLFALLENDSFLIGAIDATGGEVRQGNRI